MTQSHVRRGEGMEEERAGEPGTAARRPKGTKRTSSQMVGLYREDQPNLCGRGRLCQPGGPSNREGLTDCRERWPDPL